MKKGQLLSQPFIYIFALIVGALILVYGVKLVWDVVETAEAVETGSFLKDLEAETGKLYSLTAGSNDNFLIDLPDGITHVCIKNIDETPIVCQEKTSEGTKACSFSNIDPDLSLLLDESQNIFLMPMGVADFDMYTIDGLETEENSMLCIQNGVRVKLTSKGISVKAS